MVESLQSFESYFYSKGFHKIAGVDEAGRGPLAGPVVAACVIFPPHFNSPHIRDSKQLSSRRRERAYYEIMTQARIGLGIVTHEVIDQINILQASLLAMRRAVLSVTVSPDVILIDGPHPFGQFPIEQVPIIEGDRKSISIAAASIIAKVTRDKIMDRYDTEYPQYGFSKHKGYPTAEHVEKLREFGATPIHRLSFGPVRRSRSVSL